MKTVLSYFAKFAGLRSVTIRRHFAVVAGCLAGAACRAADAQRTVTAPPDEFGIGAFAHENWKVLFVLAGALGILGLLGFFYLKRWLPKPGLRKRHSDLSSQTIVALGLTDATRKPWIYSETTAPPANGQWLKSPSVKERAGTLLVQGNTEVDELYVDGRFVGMAPARLRLKEGHYAVEIRRAGFKSYRRQISVIVDTEVTLRAVFEKESASIPKPWEVGAGPRPHEPSVQSPTQFEAR